MIVYFQKILQNVLTVPQTFSLGFGMFKLPKTV